MDAETTIRLQPDAVDRALTLANVAWTDLKRGSHPDTGAECLYLDIGVREYSAFLVALAVQYRHVDDLIGVADRVRLQHTKEGDTRFWLPGVVIRGV
jgi:hypothetical protein